LRSCEMGFALAFAIDVMQVQSNIYSCLHGRDVDVQKCPIEKYQM
jgi:hypothetical protein